jgi:hypothetical protein
MGVILEKNRMEYYTKKYSAEIARILDKNNCDMTGPYLKCPSPFGRPLESMAYHEWFVHQSFKGSQNITFSLARPENGYVINLQYADIEYIPSLEEAVRRVAEHLENSVTSSFFQKYYQEKYADMLGISTY